MNFEDMNLDELLKVPSNSNDMTGKLFTSADVDVVINKEPEVNEETKEETQMLVGDSQSNDEETKEQEDKAEENRKLAMKKLEEYEAEENKLTKLEGEMELLNQQLESLISEIKLENKELIDKINAKSNEILAVKTAQDKIKSTLVPLQRLVYEANNEDKTLQFNKVKSTYVASTEKNQFDLKLFREEKADFWKEHLDVMEPYATITQVSDYIKITISKK